MPTFNRVKVKQPTAELKWFQNGKLWPSRHDAQDFLRARGEKGRERDPRQGPRNPESPAPERAWNAKPAWKTRSSFSPASAEATADRQASSRVSGDKPDWKPKGSFKPKEAGYSSGLGDKPAWKPKSSAGGSGFSRSEKPARKSKDDSSRLSSGKPEWKPKGSFKPKEAGYASGWGEKPSFAKATDGRPGWKSKSAGSARDQARSSFRPKSYTPKPDDDGASRSSRAQSRDRAEKLDWKPKSAPRPGGPNAGFAKSETGDAPKRKWVPKAEYKKSLGIEARRDDKWRPGGEHKDPKQKYKDAKKAKWTRVKATIRARSSKPRKPKDE